VITHRWKSYFLAGVMAFLANPAFGQTTAFTYQGRLSSGGNPASGVYEMQFKLFDNPNVGAGTQQGSTVTNNSVQAANGSFTVQLDFGAEVFNGAARFLEIAVRPAGNADPFTVLSPRQQVTSTPYALRTLNAAAADGLSVACVSCITSSQIGSVNASSVTGTLPVATVPSGSSNYIQNTATAQPSSNFNISGDGVIGGNLTMSGKFTTFGKVAVGANTQQQTVGLIVFGPDGVSWPQGGAVQAAGNLSFGVAGYSDQAMGIYGYSGGASLNGPAIRAENTNPSGIGIFSTNISSDANLVVSNGGTGDLIRGFCSTCGSPAFTVQNNGRVTTVAGMYAQRNAGGLDGVAIRADNTNPSGIGIWSTTASNDANLVVSNGGTGDLIRGFCAGCGSPSFSVTNGGTTVTRVLQITGGSDLAEHFEVADGIEPGMVVAIDPRRSGTLTISRGAYNRSVAGVVSGARNLNAGLVLPEPTGAGNSTPVTLSGRVWVYCDASRNPIEPGDLLTTSAIPGHAMKVTDHKKAQGAIIGKAMTGLKSGRGLVLLLASLQ